MAQCRARRGLAAMLVVGLTTSALAESAGGWLEQETMTGDWGGLRTSLAEQGFSFSLAFVTETAGNVSGGRSRGVTYTHEIAAGLDVDLGKLAGLDGATLHLQFVNRSGNSLAEDRLGSIFQPQDVFGGSRQTRLAELSVEQSLLDDRVNIRLGRITAGDRFASSELYCNFISNVICGEAASLSTNVNFTTPPVSSWGGIVKVRPTEKAYLQLGAFEDNPTSSRRHGFDFGTGDATGAMLIVEGGLAYGLGETGLPGNVKLGYYHNTSNVEDFRRDVRGGSAILSGLAFRKHSGKNGGYVLLDQMVYREEAEADRGLTALLALTFAERETSLLPFFVMGGLSYKGLIGGRDDDVTSFGVAYGKVSGQLADAQRDARSLGDPVGVQTEEIVLELTHRFQVAPWLSLTPGLQYFVRPGGTGEISDAFVLALKSEIKF